MENKRTHIEIVEFLAQPNALDWVAQIVSNSSDKDGVVRRILLALAVTQTIALPQKDLLRKEIRAWFKLHVGDREFFADSDIHRRKRRK
jgi:hypothetical protein